jgi:hypothetical protein
MRRILKGYGGGWRATFGRENTASLSRKFERRVLNHVWWCCSAGSMNRWVKRLFWPEVGWFGCAKYRCDCWVSGEIDSDWYGLIASRLAPTVWFPVGHRFCVHLGFVVGASLLAMAVCQSTLMVTAMASSRASPLPQVLWLPGIDYWASEPAAPFGGGRRLGSVRCRNDRAARSTRRPWR